MLKDALAEVKEELEGEVDQIDLPLDDVSTTITNNLNSCIIMLHINLRANHFFGSEVTCILMHSTCISFSMKNLASVCS